MPSASPATPRRSGSRGLRVVAIIVAVLLILVIAADRVGDLVAENVAADKLQSSQDLSSKPDVDIEGIPFLTQFASGHYDNVKVTANDVALRGTSLSLTRVVVRLSDLTVSRNFSSFRVEQASATGTVSYADLGKALGIDLTYVPDGKVRASKEITVLGRTFTPTITAEPRFADGALTFAATQASDLGPLAGDVARASNEVFGTDVPLDGIPFQVRVNKVLLGPSGLRLDLSGSDLTYSR